MKEATPMPLSPLTKQEQESIMVDEISKLGDTETTTEKGAPVPVNEYNNPPYRYAGKLFFSTSRGGSSCTASVVGKNVLLTAAHCVFSGSFHTNILFCPQFNNGNCPVGRFSATNIFITQEYRASRANHRDVAFLRVAPSGGRSIGDVLGALQVRYNQPYQFSHVALGYPGNIGGGNVMIRSLGNTDRIGFGNPNMIKVPSQMTFGASGGPVTTGNAYVQGNVCCGNPGSGYFMSPYYDNTVKQLFDQANA